MSRVSHGRLAGGQVARALILHPPTPGQGYNLCPVHRVLCDERAVMPSHPSRQVACAKGAKRCARRICANLCPVHRVLCDERGDAFPPKPQRPRLGWGTAVVRSMRTEELQGATCLLVKDTENCPPPSALVPHPFHVFCGMGGKARISTYFLSSRNAAA